MAAEPSVTTQEATDIDLASALQQYMQTVPQDDKQSSQSELAKFSRWVGGDRPISSLAPPEIGEYSDFVSAGGTAPAATERLGVVKGFLAYLKKKGMVEKNSWISRTILLSRIFSSQRVRDIAP